MTIDPRCRELAEQPDQRGGGKQVGRLVKSEHLEMIPSRNDRQNQQQSDGKGQESAGAKQTTIPVVCRIH